jgi:predicted Zn-dependent protease
MIDNTDSDALYLMGITRLKQGSPKLAVESLNKALLFVPTGWCEPYDQLALAYGKLNQKPRASYASGMAAFCHKRPADAQRQLKTLISGPVKVDALLGLALIAETESKNPEAVTWYKQVLTFDRKNGTAISALSRLGVGPTGSSTTQGPS